MKSRRAASSCQSSVKATVACRPSVARSQRSVVTSTGPPGSTAVTVPCAEAGRHDLDAVALEQRDHPLGRMGRCQVDIGDVDAEQGVAHRAADEAHLARRRAEHLAEVRPALRASRHAAWGRVSRSIAAAGKG